MSQKIMQWKVFSALVRLMCPDCPYAISEHEFLDKYRRPVKFEFLIFKRGQNKWLVKRWIADRSTKYDEDSSTPSGEYVNIRSDEMEAAGQIYFASFDEARAFADHTYFEHPQEKWEDTEEGKADDEDEEIPSDNSKDILESDENLYKYECPNCHVYCLEEHYLLDDGYCPDCNVAYVLRELPKEEPDHNACAPTVCRCKVCGRFTKTGVKVCTKCIDHASWEKLDKCLSNAPTEEDAECD